MSFVGKVESYGLIALILIIICRGNMYIDITLADGYLAGVYFNPG